MKNIAALLKWFIPCIAILLQGCENNNSDEEVTVTPNVLNSFGFTLNGESWRPHTNDNNECIQTFNCSSWALSGNPEIPFYTIRAFRDPNGKTGENSENVLRFQLRDVSDTRSYTISGSYKEDLSSYVLFIINKSDGTSTRYINAMDQDAFFARVDDFIPIEGFSRQGIKGSFFGTLYNEEDSSDSLAIEKGTFTFEKINWSNYDQCPH